jgi:polysaccharide biosynthesis/export protein
VKAYDNRVEETMKMRTIAIVSSMVLVSCAGQGSAVAQTPASGLAARAPAAPVQAAATEPAGKTQPSGDYQIGPEDLLDIAVWNSPALSRTAPVRLDGMISLPLLNDVRAAGLTPMQLRDAIAKKLVEYMPNPEVSVIVREVNRFKISVLGEVRKPGRFDFKSKATVLDAIALAGGLNDFAARSRIVILRQDGEGSKRIPVNYNKIVSAASEQDDVYLQPGDVVIVP